jgi:hypothetical protein
VRPFFPFYGSKWRDAKRYTPPTNSVVEPFAGSAGYSVYWAPAKVLLIDCDPIIVAVWDYLIRVSVDEVMRLPDLEVGQSVDSLKLPQEAAWLIGFWINRGSAQPRNIKTAFSSRTDRQQLIWSQRARARIAQNLNGIRHWEIKLSSYQDAPDINATWFIDPPYMNQGRHYHFHFINYGDLALWCKSRLGQITVCEQSGAAWLPFKMFANIKSRKGRSEEMVWTNTPTTLRDLWC